MMGARARRDFLLQIGGARRVTGGRLNPRGAVALRLREIAAIVEDGRPPEEITTNGDEVLYPNQIATATKGLPHSQLGEVDMNAYATLLKACASQKHSDAENIIIGFGRKLVNLESGFAYDLEGGDSHTFTAPPPPAFASSHLAAEMIELYWQSLAREVPFSQWATDPIVNNAAAEISSLPDYKGPRDAAGKVTPANVFRGNPPGCTTGPYLSQFLLKPVNIGSTPREQRYRTGAPSVNYMTGYSEWLLIQSGLPPYLTEQFDPTFRYIFNGRSLAQFVHYDYIIQAFLQAALILAADCPESLRKPYTSVLSDSNPYKMSRVQAPYGSFGPPMLHDWLGRLATLATRTIFHDKWQVHRRLRPELFGGRVYNMVTGAATYPIHSSLLNSVALKTNIQTAGTSLLPQAYVEGCPLHPSYPAGHAVLSGACATLLKAFFDEKAVVEDPVVPSVDGLSLIPYTDTALTVGGEINKLAYNIPMARNWSGIHYRSDTDASHIIGEQVAICFLQDQVNCFTEVFPGFAFTRFDGTPVTIAPGLGDYAGLEILTPGH